jgi:fluoroquinolone transport system permease protein
LLQIPKERAIFVAAILFLEISVIGFYFITASILFEKSQKVLSGLVVTPLKSGEYLTAKSITFSLLSLFFAIIITWITVDQEIDWLHIAAGTLLTALFFIAVSFTAVSKFQNINDFFVTSVTYLAILNLPLLPFLGVLQSYLFYLLPTHASLIVLKAAFTKVSAIDLYYAYAYLTLSIIGMFFLAQRAFYQNIIARLGEE